MGGEPRTETREWQLQQLGDLGADAPNAIVDGPFGSNLKVSDYRETGVPVLQGGNITGDSFRLAGLRYVSHSKARELGRSLARVGDLLVVKIGSVGYSAIIDTLGPHDSALIPANLLKATFNQRKVDTRYVHKWLTSESGRRILIDSASQTAQPALTLGRFRKIAIPLPPLPEQRRIAEILDTLDGAIRKTEQVIAKLQQMNEGLLHDLLTRGIDSHGHLRNPHTHPEQFKDSPLGRIPKDWEVVKLGTVCRYQNGAPFPSTDYQSDGVALLRPGNIQMDEFVVWDEAHTTYLPPKWERLAPDFLVGPTEVVMNLTAQSLEDGFLGRVCVTPEGTHCLLNQRIARFRVFGCDSMFFFWICKSPPFRAQIDRLCQGTKVQHLYNRNLDSLLIQVPRSSTEQKSIAERLFTHGRRIAHEEHQLAKLRLLKQGLMDDLLTGRRRVRVKGEG